MKSKILHVFKYVYLSNSIVRVRFHATELVVCGEVICYEQEESKCEQLRKQVKRTIENSPAIGTCR